MVTFPPRPVPKLKFVLRISERPKGPPMRVNVPTFRKRSPPTASPKRVSVMIPAAFFSSSVPAVICTSPPRPGPNSVRVVIVEPSSFKLPVVIATSPARSKPNVCVVMAAPLLSVTESAALPIPCSPWTVTFPPSPSPNVKFVLLLLRIAALSARASAPTFSVMLPALPSPSVSVVSAVPAPSNCMVFAAICRFPPGPSPPVVAEMDAPVESVTESAALPACTP